MKEFRKSGVAASEKAIAKEKARIYDDLPRMERWITLTVASYWWAVLIAEWFWMSSGKVW